MESRSINNCISGEEIEQTYRPYVYKQFASSDPRMLYYLTRSRLRWKARRLLSGAKQLYSGPPRPPQKVKQNYEEIWTRFQFNDLSPSSDNKPYINKWQDDYQEAHGWGVVRVHLLCLMHLIEILKPRSVLEIGFGRGLNLIALAARFPDIHFSGIELSESGFREAQELVSRQELPQQLLDFIPFKLKDLQAVKNINFQRASAESLPFEADSVDLLYTRQALEQMELIRDQVLGEISRVANKNVVMFEAFRDWNESGMCRDRNAVTNYFAARLSDLSQYGLKPIFTKSDLPTKVYMHVGLVVSEKEN